jgi:hypothetical protein
MALGVALNRGEHVDIGFEIEVPSGEYDDSVEVSETIPLDLEERSAKICYLDISMVIDENPKLIEIIDDVNSEDDWNGSLRDLRNHCSVQIGSAISNLENASLRPIFC